MPNKPEFPKELLEASYPPDLLDDLSGNEPERRIRMAKYMVMRQLRLPFGEEKLLQIAKDEVPGVKSFQAAIRAAWSDRFRNGDGLTRGDIELAAEELQVYELLWPFDQEEMTKAVTAEHALIS